MNQHKNEAFRGLEAFLLDDSDMSVEELRSELTELGVNVDAFLTNFSKIVSKGYRSQLRRAAESAAQTVRSAASSAFGDLSKKTYAELDALFRQIREGAFGDHLQNAVLARCRNDKGSVSETELRSWLEDIAIASKQ
jgi:hypothetical protein